jgi:hypothetical protein
VAIISVIDKRELRVCRVHRPSSVGVQSVEVVTLFKVTGKSIKNQSKMNDFIDSIKSEDTLRTHDFPPPDKDADNAGGGAYFDEAVIPTKAEKEPAEILVEFDQHYKKVIKLNDGGYDSLVKLFSEAVAEDPFLTKYVNSTFVFETFNQKFNAWVRLDQSQKLNDGSHLKVTFLPQTKQDTEGESKPSKISNSSPAESSDSGGDNCKLQSSSSDDSVMDKTICDTTKSCLTEDENNSVTSHSVDSHDLTDNSQDTPASEGLCH